MVKGKGSKERIVPIAEEALNSVLQWLNLRDCIGKGKEKPFIISDCEKQTNSLRKLCPFQQGESQILILYQLTFDVKTHLLS